jgi:hypothetical protein
VYTGYDILRCPLHFFFGKLGGRGAGGFTNKIFMLGELKSKSKILVIFIEIEGSNKPRQIFFF